MRSLLLFLLLVIVPAAARADQTILVLGDSISAGYGLAQGEGWVALLEQRIQREKLAYQVVNASISGETTLGGLNRIPATLEEHRPAVVIVALGGNDGLRGNPLEETRRNLIGIVTACRKAGAKVVIAGMRIPPNYGPVYTRRFEGLFAEVARQQNVSLVPFMLQGFADDRNLFQADGIHPAAGAQSRILDNIYRRLRPLLLPRARGVEARAILETDSRPTTPEHGNVAQPRRFDEIVSACALPSFGFRVSDSPGMSDSATPSLSQWNRTEFSCKACPERPAELKLHLSLIR